MTAPQYQEESCTLGNDYSENEWPAPKDRDFASLSDYHLYGEVLHIAASEPFVTIEKLRSPEEGLRDRFRKLLLIQSATQTNVSGLVSILVRFGWLRPEEKERHKFTITIEGRQVAKLSQEDSKSFRRLVLKRLQQRYTVPGWFIQRLYKINPEGHGEVVLPAPRKSFSGVRRVWRDNNWSEELYEEIYKAHSLANAYLPGSFPIDADEWFFSVTEAWDRISKGEPPRNSLAKTNLETGRQTMYGERSRLSHAMREAAVSLLFGVVPPHGSEPDFSTGTNPIHSRSFSVWCPRLGELELIFYTDYHPLVSGRIIVPCCAFRTKGSYKQFESIPEICDPMGRTLHLHQPQWNGFRSIFLTTLLNAYETSSSSNGSLYISLLRVRDEVCRQLRLNWELFDTFIENAYEDSMRETRVNGKTISIALESDIRPEQRSAVGLNQRPVYVNRIPQSLIAIRSN